MNAKEIRSLLTESDRRDIVRRVMKRQCMCCGDSDEVSVMNCGHLVCDHCTNHKDDCLACAIAT